MLAAVMPLPSEEVTPPVTKTYFDMGRAPPGVFRMLPKTAPATRRKARAEPERPGSARMKVTPVERSPRGLAAATATRTELRASAMP